LRTAITAVGSLPPAPSMFHDAERALRGTTHGEIGAYLLALWGLPLDVLSSVRVANLLAFEQQPACT
jgi:HD-like signal output (HDOD) protein